jgi:hypothetical protein
MASMEKDGYTPVLNISECKPLKREFERLKYVYETEKWCVSWKRNKSQLKWKMCILDQLEGFHPFDASVIAKSFRRFTTLFAAIVPFIIDDIKRNSTICRWSKRWAKSKHWLQVIGPVKALPPLSIPEIQEIPKVPEIPEVPEIPVVPEVPEDTTYPDMWRNYSGPKRHLEMDEGNATLLAQYSCVRVVRQKMVDERFNVLDIHDAHSECPVLCSFDEWLQAFDE